MKLLEWLMSLKAWQLWLLGLLVWLFVLKLYEWKEERKHIALARAQRKIAKTSTRTGKKKKPMTPQAKAARKKMKWEIDRIMERQARKGKGFDNGQPGTLNDII